MSSRSRLAIVLGFFLSGYSYIFAQGISTKLVDQPWLEANTTHFNIYSPAPVQDVDRVAAQLEQFCKAYSLLAGNQAVTSPPTVVIAFPNHPAMMPFLPLYNGQPKNISGFFLRDSDENLIVLSLADSADMEIIFHEYAHLLFRHNDLFWPLWLKEGMSEIYSTFQVNGREVEIARPIEHHLELLEHEPLMPLSELFSVTPDSPQYNESTRQGIFYAESWLLTHYLMTGDNAFYRARFAGFTQLLKDGQIVEQAFTNALHTTLPAMQFQLQQYLAAGQFNAIQMPLALDVSAPVYVTTRRITPVEIYFHLGDELLRTGQLDAAGDYFTAAQKLAPASPLPYEGLGLLAAKRGRPADAIAELEKSLQLGSGDFLTHYYYAKEMFEQMASAPDKYSRISDSARAAEIRAELQKSVTLMPVFAAGHDLLGFFELVQDDDLNAAQQQLQEAIALEPENPSYLLSLAQVQLVANNPDAARQTLSPLLLPTTDPQLRVAAGTLLKETKQ